MRPAATEFFPDKPYSQQRFTAYVAWYHYVALFIDLDMKKLMDEEEVTFQHDPC